ncbi:MAG: macro domain-containing protein [Actinomycetota bacterium]|jgi:O-acetyl-ADP-ribose deacetylase (regulator of RNase III)|nr:macro domain-containing protein [Actinomycetota bacterium]
MIQLQVGDITEVQADAIVNAANSHLVPGGGVSGAIHRCGGSEIDTAGEGWLEENGLVYPGSAAITTAGALNAHFVIHAVGPIWVGGMANEDELLAETYRASIQLAEERALTSIAFPSISTGFFGYPVSAAAPIAMHTIIAALESSRYVTDVKMVLFDQETHDVYASALGSHAPLQ